MTDSVLIVEDDNDIAELIKVQLKQLSLTVDICRLGEEALKKVTVNRYSVVVLDVMLPDSSGLDICRTLRDKQPELAIIMLTSRTSETDRVLGLELGADDYMTKPFSVRELQARVRAQLRRLKLTSTLKQQVEPEHKALVLGKLAIDELSHQAKYSGQTLNLTTTEFDLLRFLAQHPNQVFSREQLLSKVWGYAYSGYEHTVNSHINRLRNKLEVKPTHPEIVQTVWGVGYKLNSQGVL